MYKISSVPYTGNSMISSEKAEAKGDGLVGKGGSGRQAGKNIFGRRVCPIPAKLFSAIVF